MVKAKASNPGKNASIRGEVLVGAKGMTLVVFQLDIGAPKTVYGPATGTAYSFGGRRKVGRVDNRDLKTKDPHNPGFLEMFDHGKPLFKETTDPGEPPPKRQVKAPAVVEKVKQVYPWEEDYTAAEEEAVSMRIVEEETLATEDKAPEPIVIDWRESGPGLDVAQLVCDPGEMTVKEIRELSGQLSSEQWKAMLEMELSAKHRASAITFMEAAIENLGR